MFSLVFSVALVIEAMVALLLLGSLAAVRVLFRGYFALRRWRREAARPDYNLLLKSPLAPSVAAIAVVPHGDPQYIAFVRRLLETAFGDREVIVVLNGASLRAVETWSDEFHLFPSFRVTGEPLPAGPVRGVFESRDPIQLVVVDKQAGTPADALNLAVNASAAPYIALFDSNSEFDQDALLRLILPILQEPDTLAVCGSAPPQSSGAMAGRFAEIEALRAWLGCSLAFAGWNRLLPSPGQAAIIQRKAIIDSGGWSGGLLKMFLQLHAHAHKKNRPYRIAFLPDAVSRTPLAGSMEDLRKHLSHEQQWFAGSVAAGALGSWSLFALFWARFLRPLLETLLYVLTAVALVMRWIGAPLALLVILATVGSGILISMTAVVLRELAERNATDPAELRKLFLAAIPENLGYRQMRNLWLIVDFFQRPA